MLEILIFTIIIIAYCFTKAFGSALKKSKFRPQAFKSEETLSHISEVKSEETLNLRPEVKGEENLSHITKSMFDPEEFLGSIESLNIEYYPYNDHEVYYYSHYDENTCDHVLTSMSNTKLRVINIENIKRKYVKPIDNE